ncbi:MAG: hypothetical protein ACRCYZ_06910 [Alphaproteobacteria bacterium]
MRALTTTSQLIRLVTGSAGNIKAAGSWLDTPNPITSSSSYTVTGEVLTSITTAATTTIVPSPGANVARNVKDLSIHNDHASISNDIRIERFDGTDSAPDWEGTLAPGEHVQLDANGNWSLYGADGVLREPSLTTYQQLAAVPSQAVTAADADTLKIFARKRAGRMFLKYIGASGVDQTVQDRISENGFSMYLPNNGTTVGLNYGIAWTTGGTVSHPTPSATSPARYNQQKRTRWANVVTTTNQILGIRTAAAEKRYWRGNAAGLGGFNFHARFAVGLWPAATVRLFVGLNDSTAGWVASDTLTGNGCGFWHNTTDAATVLSFVTRDGTTATNAGITLTAPLAAGQWFDAYIWSAPNGGVIGYALVDGTTDTVLVDTTTSTTIPLPAAFLGQELAMSNGTANVTVTTTAFELAAHSCQSDI